MDHLTTEESNPASSLLDEMTARDIVSLMNAEDATVAAAVAAAAGEIAESIERIANQLRAGGRLFYIGAGTSGRLGVLDASECPPTFRTPPEMIVGIIAGGDLALRRAIEGAEDDSAQGARDLDAHNLSARDVVVGIATSGRTPYVIGAMQRAAELDATVIGISCNRASEMTRYATVMIDVVVGPEILTGSTRLKAGTATKLVLNMLSTGSMVLMGKTFGNLMVDLYASNSKLVDRSIRMIRELTGVSPEDARRHLGMCDGSVKRAVVAIRCGVSPENARLLLDESRGRLRAALQLSERTTIASAEPATAYMIGIDGGGSTTKAALGRVENGTELVLVGEGVAGPSNPAVAGLANTLHQIDEAIEKAFVAAGVRRQVVDSLHAGLAGAGDREVAIRIEQGLIERGMARQVRVSDDGRAVIECAQLMSRGNSGDNFAKGIALIAGTGSVAFGFFGEEVVVRAGGWGPLLGDGGSGYSIGMAALRDLCQSHDRGDAPTGLHSAMLAFLQLERAEQLKGWIHAPSTSRRDIASLAPLVFEFAQSELQANRIIDAAAEDLSELVIQLSSRMEPFAEGWVLAISGSLLVNQPLLRERLLAGIDRSGLPLPRTLVIPSAVIGAMHLAWHNRSSA